MKNSPVAEQSHEHAGALTLGHLRADFNEQRLNVSPVDIGQDWPSKYKLEGAPMLSLHLADGIKKWCHFSSAGNTTPTTHGLLVWVCD